MKKVGIGILIGVCLILGGIALGGLNEVTDFHILNNIKWNAVRKDDIYLEASLVKKIDIELNHGTVSFHEKAGLQGIEVYATNVYSGFEIKETGNQITIKQPYYKWWKNIQAAQIDIYVPYHYSFDEVDIDMSAGTADLNHLTAYQIDVDTAAGELSMDDITCDELNIDASMGKTSLTNCSVSRHLDVDLGMGDIYMMLKGQLDDYNYNVDVGMGNVVIGDYQFSGIADQTHYNSGVKTIDVDCGMGNVTIEMED